jgi:hypothetical protein
MNECESFIIYLYKWKQSKDKLTTSSAWCFFDFYLRIYFVVAAVRCFPFKDLFKYKDILIGREDIRFRDINIQATQINSQGEVNIDDDSYIACISGLIY